MSAIMRLQRRLKGLVSSAKRERGSSLAEFALMIPLLGLLLFGVIDYGRAFYLGIEVNNAAYTGALYGVQNRTDTTGMQNAAKGDAPDVAGITAVASQGCECSDGSHVTTGLCSTTASLPSCVSGTNVVYYVSVTTTASYKPIIPWPNIPKTISLQGSAKLRASQ